MYLILKALWHFHCLPLPQSLSPLHAVSLFSLSTLVFVFLLRCLCVVGFYLCSGAGLIQASRARKWSTHLFLISSLPPLLKEVLQSSLKCWINLVSKVWLLDFMWIIYPVFPSAQYSQVYCSFGVWWAETWVFSRIFYICGVPCLLELP